MKLTWPLGIATLGSGKKSGAPTPPVTDGYDLLRYLDSSWFHEWVERIPPINMVAIEVFS
jgi:hypothetical protein